MVEIGESYVLGGELGTLRDAVEKAFDAGGHQARIVPVPTWVVRLATPLGPLLGLSVADLVSASDGVTYWGRDDKARRELGYAPRDLVNRAAGGVRLMADRVRWLGHSTVLIELDGVLALTDPLLRKQVLHLRRSAPLDVEEAAEVDVVLLSHLHYDHLDLPSLRQLDRTIPVVAPRGAGPLVSRQGFRSVVELSAGEETAVGDVTVRAVPAEHGSSRIVGKKAEALGYVVAGSRDVYFAGDTDLFPGMAELAGALDVALVPDLGLGAVDRPGPPRSAPGRRGARRPAPARRGADPLGDVLPADVEAPHAAGVPQRSGRGVRAAGRRARARRSRSTCFPSGARSISRKPVPEQQVGDAAGRDREPERDEPVGEGRDDGGAG